MGAVGLCLVLAGCSVLGIARRQRMVEVRDVTVPGSGDKSAAIVNAAIGLKWTATVQGPDVVRCTLRARNWNIVVDVRHFESRFSINYVDSSGLFYRPEAKDIHPTYNVRVAALRDRIMRSAAQRMPLQPQQASVPSVKPYTIESFLREPGDKYAYRFVLKLNDASSVDMTLSRRIQADLRQSICDDYVSAAGAKDSSSLQIDFPEYVIREGKVVGRAVVMTVELLEFIYDPETAHGRLAVKVNPQQYETTRQWVRNNIATLAKDKSSNILNAISGKPRFTIGREVLRDDGVLEVEFHAGE